MIFKEAQQINFTDNETLYRELSRLRDREYGEYLTILSQIHADLKSLPESSLDEVIQNRIDMPFYQKKISDVINAIGPQVFTSNRFESISQNLAAIRSGATEEAAPEEVPAEEATVPNTIEERIQEAKSRDYPVSSPAEQEEVNRMLESLDFFYAQLNEKGLPNYQRNQVYEAIVELLEDLEKISRGEAPELPDEPEVEVEEEVIQEEEEAPSDFFTSSKAGSGLSLDADDQELVKENESRREKSTIRKTEEEAGAHSLYANMVEEEGEGEPATTDKVISQFFDLQSNPPVFKDDVYEKAYQGFLSFAEYLSETVSGRVTREQFNAPNNMAIEFNDLLFSIKTLEKKVKEELLAFRDQGILDEKQYAEFYNKVNSNLITSRIATDEALFRSKLMLPIVYMGNSYLARTLYSPDKASYKVIGLEQADQNLVRDTAKDTLHKLLYPKFRKVLDSTNSQFYSSMNNFLASMAVNSGILAYNVKRTLTGKPSYESKAFCPTCSKEITWTYSPEIQKSTAMAAGGVTKGQKARGFELPMYSLFRKEGDGISAITLTDLLYQESEGQMVEKKFAPPGTEDYNDELEIRTISGYSGARTWKQIESLIYSNDRSKHEEGMHRRAAALKSMGAIPAGQFGKKTKTTNARAVRIKNVMSECPYSGETEDDFCGLSYTPTEDGSAFNMQPVESPFGERWAGKNIESRDLRKAAVKKTAGGYKFSRVSFSCPAHWQDVDSKGVEQKHFRLAVSSSGPAGSEGYTPPVDGTTGINKDMPEGTMSYLVCGAATSISSFDRDPSSVGYIVSVMSKIKSQNLEGYVHVLDYLARQGVDIGDLIHVSTAVEKTPYTMASISSDRKERISKIAELLSEAAVRTDLPEYQILKDVMLVCSHGHRFTIGQSVNFNQTHAGVTVRKNFSLFKNVMETSGNANFEALVRSGVLIKVTSDLQLEGRHTFAEWDGKSLRNLAIPIQDAEGETQFYIYNPAKKVARNALHVSNKDYTQSHEPFIVSEIIDQDISSSLQMVDLAKRQDDDNTGITGIENLNADTLGQKLGESEKPPVIPGMYASEDADTNVHDRVEPLARAVSSSLKVIMTWTKGVANSDLAKALTFAEPKKIAAYSKQLGNSLIAGRMIRYVIPDVVEENGRRRRVYREEAFPGDLAAEFGTLISDELMKTSNYYGFFEGALSLENSPVVITDTVISAIYAFMEKEEMEGEIDFGEGVDDNAVSAFIADFLSKEQGFIKAFAREGNQKKKTFVAKDYRSRIYLHSYALYLAEIIVGVYTGFLANDAVEPIGYDFGLDLSTVDKVLDVTEEDLAKITLSIPKNYFFGIREDQSDVVLGRLARNIDRAYDRIRYSMANGRGFAATPAALTKSRDLIVQRLHKFVPEDEQESVSKIFDAAFPVKFLNFDDSLNPKNFTPLPSRNPETFLIPGGLDGTVSEGGVVINEGVNYRSDRFQVGMVGPKPARGNMRWPMTLKDGFVGVHLPFAVPSKTEGLTISTLSQTPIADFSVLVDTNVSSEDSSPLDISPFFMRGRDEAQNKMIMDIRSGMKQEVEKFRGAIETADPEKRAKLVHALNAKLREFHARLKSIPPRIRTKASLLNTGAVNAETGEGKAVVSPFTAMTLVSPDEVADMVAHPFLIYPDYDYKADEARVKKFFANAYKLDLVAEVISRVTGEEVDVDDLMSPAFYRKLEGMERKVRNKINTSLDREYSDAVGMYYDVISNQVEEADEEGGVKPSDKNTGSYIGYVFNYIPDITLKRSGPVVSPTEEGHRSLIDMTKLVRKAIRDGLVDTSKANDLLGRIPEFLTGYLEDSTAGEFEKTSKDADSEIIVKSAERRRALERIILSMGFDGLYID